MNFDELFPDNREEGKTLVRQCQLVMLRMLKILDYLCTKHKIQYFLVGGSLLGAIRHQGFIPWDDDLDVGMTRENYEKFVKYAVSELPEDIFFQSEETDPHFPAFDYAEAKLRDKYSNYPRKNNKWHEGLQIDIFVYDRAFLPYNILIIVENVILNYCSKNNKAKSRILKWICKQSPIRLIYASGYLKKIGMWKFGANYIKEEELLTLIQKKFEEIEVYIPSGWHNCLKRQYGNYMQLPPIKKRNAHFSAEEHPDPFKPCQHDKILFWESRRVKVTNSIAEKINSKF